MELQEKIRKAERWLHVTLLALLLLFLCLTYPETVADHGPLLYWIVFFDFICFVSCAYFSSYILLPRFFVAGKFLKFVFYYFLALTVATTLILLDDIMLLSLFADPSERQKTTELLLFYGSTFGMMFMICSVGVAVRALIYWIKSMNQVNLLQKEHLQTELAFLHSQINPHFLFNMINLVFGHIDKSNKTARDIIVRFSELLRYQLYECNVQFIPIEKEVHYLNHYIDLQKLRKNTNINCSVRLSEGLYGFDVPPMLMVPLVENAFKYVSYDEQQENFLDIELHADSKEFHFSCINSCAKLVAHDVVKTKGLGLQNVRRRLELLYPGKHELIITDLEDMFNVQLTIKR